MDEREDKAWSHQLRGLDPPLAREREQGMISLAQWLGSVSWLAGQSPAHWLFDHPGRLMTEENPKRDLIGGTGLSPKLLGNLEWKAHKDMAILWNCTT